MLDQFFGGELSVPLRFIIAFGIVLSLIALVFVGLRRFAGRRLPLANTGRARQPRLGVLDAFAIDARRRLVLIRRDNVEHLIMIGGPNDVLIESEIVRAPAQAALPAQQQRTQQRPVENGRAVSGPPAAAPATPQRLPATDVPAPVAMAPAPAEPEIRPPPFRSAMPRPTPPLQANVSPLPPKAPLRPLREQAPAPQASAPPQAPASQAPAIVEETAAPVAPPAAAKPKADVDPLYADIEKKLSEALARPTSPAPQARPTSPSPQARSPSPAPQARSAPPAPARREPVMDAPPPRSAPAPAPAPQESKSHLDALEEEMASLLGRERPS